MKKTTNGRSTLKLHKVGKFETNPHVKVDKNVMKMYSLLILFLSQVTCDIQRFDSGGFKAEFSVINKGRVRHVLQHFKDHNLQDCIVKCIIHLNCTSINYNSLTSVCELVDRNFDSKIPDLNSTGWTNYGTPSKGIEFFLIFWKGINRQFFN